jgi:hypothetical protein
LIALGYSREELPVQVHVLIPSHPEAGPDPPPDFVHHYTTGLKLRSIITSGFIDPSTAHIEPVEKPVVWFSSSERWEPTATKVSVPGMPGQAMTAVAQNGLVRLTVPASTAPHAFEELPEIAGTPLETCMGLLLSGLRLGSDPTSWRFSLTPVPTSFLRKVAFYDFANDRWLAVDMAALARWK